MIGDRDVREDYPEWSQSLWDFQGLARGLFLKLAPDEWELRGAVGTRRLQHKRLVQLVCPERQAHALGAVYALPAGLLFVGVGSAWMAAEQASDAADLALDGVSWGRSDAAYGIRRRPDPASVILRKHTGYRAEKWDPALDLLDKAEEDDRSHLPLVVSCGGDSRRRTWRVDRRWLLEACRSELPSSCRLPLPDTPAA